MILTVFQVYPNGRDLRCRDEEGREHVVDVFTDGTFGDIEPEALVGRQIEADYLHPHIEFAANPRLLGKGP